MGVLVLFLVQANPNPCPPSPVETQPPSLIVQVVVDQAGPISGAEVTVKPEHANPRLKAKRAMTDKDGYARFVVPSNADYTIEAKDYGFKRMRMEHVHLQNAGSSAPAHVQLRLRLSGPVVTVY